MHDTISGKKKKKKNISASYEKTMPSPELRTVGKRDKCGWNKIKTQARTSPKKEEKKQHN